MSALEAPGLFQRVVHAGIIGNFSVFLDGIYCRVCSSEQSSNACCEPENLLFFLTKYFYI